MNNFEINITLSQLNNWSEQDTGISLCEFSTVNEFINELSDFTPKQVFSRAKSLIIDEGVAPGDVTFNVLDEKTGVKYKLLAPLEFIFS